MKKLVLLSLVSMGLSAFAYEPFTPITGITTGLSDETCVAYDGDRFQKEPEIDYFSAECLGLGGWRVINYGGDARSWIKLINGKYEFNLQGKVESVGQFPNINSGVEWRVKRVLGKGAAPIAVLVATSGQDPDDIEKTNGEVLIIKLSAKKSCIMNKIRFNARDEKAEKAAQEQARAEADAKAAAYVCK